MKRATMIIILTLFCFSLFSQAPIDVTVYGDKSYSPYSFSDNGKAAGIYVDILKEAFSRMDGYNVTITVQPWKRCLSQLEAGKYFAIFPPYYRPVERPYMNPYSEAILNEEVIILCSSKTNITANSKWPEDFYGLKIGINNGYSLGLGGKAFEKAVKEGLIVVDQVGGNETNIQKLSHGRIDAYLTDKLAAQWTIRKMDKGILYSDFIEGPVTSIEKGYLGFSFDQSNFPYKDDFISKFNKVIKEMKANNEIKKIISNFK